MIKQLFFLTEMDEEEIEEVLERFPRLGERVRDWAVLAEANDHIIVHIIIEGNENLINRLKKRPEYLGSSYKEIAQKAKAGNIICRKALKQIIFTSWEIDNPDPEGPARINHRGSLKEWLDVERPTRLTGWFPAHVWFGQGTEVPNDDEVE